MSMVECIVGFFKVPTPVPNKWTILFDLFQHKKNAKICKNVQEITCLLGICFFFFLWYAAAHSYKVWSSISHINQYYALLINIIHAETYSLFRLNRHIILQMMICEVTITTFRISNKNLNNYRSWKRELQVKTKAKGHSHLQTMGLEILTKKK